MGDTLIATKRVYALLQNRRATRKTPISTPTLIKNKPTRKTTPTTARKTLATNNNKP
ncbi:MAG: hypothetical protein U0Y68_01650 [Blastocatellia bacterium]